MKIVILDGALENTPYKWKTYLSDLVLTLRKNDHEVKNRVEY